MDDPQKLGWTNLGNGGWWSQLTGETIAAPAPNAAPLIYNPPPAQDPQLTTNVAVGACVVDVTNSRIYLPAQVTSGNTFSLFGEYEV